MLNNSNHIKPRKWLNQHRDHPKETIYSQTEQGTFRFIRCQRCQLAYLMGRVEE